jgi:hypothetical protein
MAHVEEKLFKQYQLMMITTITTIKGINIDLMIQMEMGVEVKMTVEVKTNN